MNSKAAPKFFVLPLKVNSYQGIQIQRRMQTPVLLSLFVKILRRKCLKSFKIFFPLPPMYKRKYNFFVCKNILFWENEVKYLLYFPCLKKMQKTTKEPPPNQWKTPKKLIHRYLHITNPVTMLSQGSQKGKKVML